MEQRKRAKNIKLLMGCNATILLFALCMLFCIIPANALAADAKTLVDETVNVTAQKLIKEVPAPTVASVGGEWTVMALARSGYAVPQSYYDAYYNNLLKVLQEKQGNLSVNKYTEYTRVILALTAMGKDVTNVGGYNLLEKLADFNQLKKQGVNGPVFALLALDSHAYEIPTVAGVSVQTTRQMLVDYILSKEITAADGTVGGFSLAGERPDADITAMAVQALSKYRQQPKVEAALARALTVLSKQQKQSGGYATVGVETPESTAQVLLACTAMNIDVAKSANFTKNNHTILDGLMTYAIADGGFRHSATTDMDVMSTEQAFCSLVAYQRYALGKNAFYDMTDVPITANAAPKTPGSSLIKYIFELPKLMKLFV